MDFFVVNGKIWQGKGRFCQALLVRSGMKAVTAEAAAIGTSRSPRDLMRCCQSLKKAMEYAQGNVSCAAVCGWLSWELR